MLSFFRFASCPMCNMRIHRLVKTFSQFPEEFTIVGIFDSPIDNLKKYVKKHDAPFTILADENNTYYRAYGIEHSITGLLKGMVVRMPTLTTGMLKGYIPSSIKGSLTTMPADFLINRKGIIERVYYGNDEGDHLPIQEVLDFSRQH